MSLYVEDDGKRSTNDSVYGWSRYADVMLMCVACYVMDMCAWYGIGTLYVRKATGKKFKCSGGRC